MSERDRFQGSTGDDEIGRWVRLADPAPAIPAQIAERVEAATRTHWQAEVERRRRQARFRRIAALAASVLVVALGSAVVSRIGGPAAPPVRVVFLVEHGWQVAADGSRIPLQLGDEIHPGAEIATDVDSRVALSLPSGHSIRVAEGSRLRGISATRWAIDQGAVYVASGTLAARSASALVLSTPVGEIRETGTQYEVRVEATQTRVRVREGGIVVEQSGTAHRAEAGTELAITRSGDVRHRSIPIWGPEWGWVGATRPPFTIEGRTLREFLQWAVREGGWRLVYDDAAVASRASTIILSGSIEGLSVEDALAAVLPTCQLTHRIEQGRLTIQAASDEESGGS